MKGPATVTAKRPRGQPGLSIADWPEADRRAWLDACRPGYRLDPGGRASYLAPESQTTFASCYGLFLSFLRSRGCLRLDAPAASQVTPQNVDAYLADLRPRVSSVTAYGYIYKLRRASELITPSIDFGWLAEIEKDLALVMVPRSKFDKFVLTDRAVEAGLTLIVEAQDHATDEVARAIGIRNGLMLALIALYPFRRKNFASLAIGETLRKIKTNWWITFSSRATKSRRADERRVHDWLVPYLSAYLNEARPMLLKISGRDANTMWVSSMGEPMTPGQVGRLISRITLQTLGVSISPHMFRTGGATSAATYAPELPHLGSALLDHTEPKVTEQNYIRTSSIAAAGKYGRLIGGRRRSSGA